jgi:hypothetical protein
VTVLRFAGLASPNETRESAELTAQMVEAAITNSTAAAVTIE